MDLITFVEGPLLRITMVIFMIAVIARLSAFVLSILRSSANRDAGRGTYILSIMGRFIAPLHMLAAKKPAYVSLRIVLHAGLVIVPVWLSSHVVLWELSRFQWSWRALPHWLADCLTLTFLGVVIFLALRRIILPHIKATTSSFDYLLLLITGVPFLTGFLSTHGVFGSLPILGTHMQVIHELSGEVMILAAAFLFCRPCIYQDKCIGCAACELACPTGTLETVDQDIYRHFYYSHYQCICCAGCSAVCPENATELRHELSVRRFLSLFSKYTIRSVELQECEQCGARFAPEPQLTWIKHKPEFENVQTVLQERQMRICPECRKINHGEAMVRAAQAYRKAYPRKNANAS